MKWVRITDHELGMTHAAEVPTGIVLLNTQWSEDSAAQPAVSMVFIPGLCIERDKCGSVTLIERRD